MKAAGTRGRRLPPGFAFRATVALIGASLTFFTAPSVWPAIQAARADGVPGIFTAEHMECVQHPGHESCQWYGDFRSEDGTVSRTDIFMYGMGKGQLQAGRQTSAVDIGFPNRVYGPGGSNEWVFTVALLLAGAALTLSQLRRIHRSMKNDEAGPEGRRAGP